MYDYYSQSPKVHVALVDTPGFDNPERSDIEILDEFVQAIKGRALSGIIFLHRITDNRMAGSALRNLKLLTEVCGDEFFRNVVIVTTMWDVVNRSVGESRERSLEANFWRQLINNGATLERYDSDHAPGSILRKFLNEKVSNAGMLSIQRESSHDGKPLAETSAGRAALESMQVELANTEQVMQELDGALRSAQSSFERERLERQKSKLVEKTEKMNYLIRKYTSNDSEDSQSGLHFYGEEEDTDAGFAAPSTMYGAESHYSYTTSLSPTINTTPRNNQAHRPKSAGVAGRSRNTNLNRPPERRSNPLHEEYPQYTSSQYNNDPYNSEQYNSEQYDGGQYNYQQRPLSSEQRNEENPWGYQENPGYTYGNTSNERPRRSFR
jgi:hypothetical protein